MERSATPAATAPSNTLTVERPPAAAVPANPTAQPSGQVSVHPRPDPVAAPDAPFDVTIIGSGPGGYVAAIRAAQLGLRTAVVEKSFLGGTCLNVGCIPTKAMLSSVEAMAVARRGKEFGFSAGEITPDYPAMIKRRDRVVDQLRGGVGQLLKKNGVTTIPGHGRLVGPEAIEVAGEAGTTRLNTRHVLLATGSEPARPPIPGADLEGVVNSDQLLRLDRVPERLAVVGAGAVGLEWGDIFAALGTKITVYEMVDQILPPADGEVAAELAKELKRKGFQLHTSAMVNGIVRKDGGLAVQFATPTGGEQEDPADVVLIATGRWPYTESLGLESVGLQLERRAIPVNERMQTRSPGIYAIGDCVPGLQLAHVASREGEVAVETIAGKEARMDYRAVPSCVYTHPEIAWVGLTEEDAREEHSDLRIGRFPFRLLGRALASGVREGFVKIIAEPRYGEILGVHMIGNHVTDLIAEPVLAMSLEGTVDELIHAIHAHPTFPEAVPEAAMDVWERAIHKG
jgi:dihydrolipoamide dehydrogenase